MDNIDLFELVAHTGDCHWKLESHKTAYINVDQSAEMSCRAVIHDVIKIYVIICVPIPVRVTGKYNQLKRSVVTTKRPWLD